VRRIIKRFAQPIDEGRTLACKHQHVPLAQASTSRHGDARFGMVGQQRPVESGKTPGQAQRWFLPSRDKAFLYCGLCVVAFAVAVHDAPIAVAAEGKAPVAAEQATVDGVLTDKDDAKVELERRRPNDPLIGVVINRTITVLGREFYQYFSATWRDKELSERYTVTIYERPTAIRGSEMWVQYGNRRVYHAFLSPSRSAAKDISRKAVEIVYKNIIDLDVQQLLFKNEDLGPEEI